MELDPATEYKLEGLQRIADKLGLDQPCIELILFEIDNFHDQLASARRMIGKLQGERKRKVCNPGEHEYSGRTCNKCGMIVNPWVRNDDSQQRSISKRYGEIRQQ